MIDQSQETPSLQWLMMVNGIGSDDQANTAEDTFATSPDYRARILRYLCGSEQTVHPGRYLLKKDRCQSDAWHLHLEMANATMKRIAMHSPR